MRMNSLLFGSPIGEDNPRHREEATESWWVQAQRAPRDAFRNEVAQQEPRLRRSAMSKKVNPAVLGWGPKVGGNWR